MKKRTINHKKLFDQMPATRFVVQRTETSSFCIVTANEKSKDFFKVDIDNLLGKTIEDLFNTEYAQNLIASLEVAFQKKMPVTIPALYDFLDKLKIHSFWVNPVLDNNGDVEFLDVIGKPGTTDLGIVERERDDALSLLTSIFDASEIGILVFNPNRNIVKMNDSFQRIYGWTEKETIGQDFVKFVTDDEKSLAKETFEKLVRDGVRQSGDVKIFCKDGSIANTIYTTAPLSLSQGRKFQVVTLFDITKRKKMELSLRVAKEQADASNNAKSSFLANMSHELRTPLNAIIGFSEMMVNESFGSLGNPKYNEYIFDVHESAKHLLDIINEVLDMSKIESGKLELDEQEIDLKELISALVRVMMPGILTNEIQITETYSDNLPRLYADPRLIRQVLINLIGNSVKYSNKKGEIQVEACCNDKGEIEIIVSDQGVGIPKNRIQEALEPFGQTHDPHTHSAIHQGTGLGLPLAKAMIEMHGALFILKSTENEGTTVKISFSKSRTRQH